MELISDILIAGFTTLFFSLIIIPFVSEMAKWIQLVDKPNHRKVHTDHIPLMGGISIAISVFFTLIFSPVFMQSLYEYTPMLLGSLVILIMGVLDDKYDIKAKYKLFIQAACAIAMVYFDVRITSFHGIMGIHEIPVIAQYILTVVVITGVVNAFNLMDGIDGLAGSLAMIGFATLSIIAFVLEKYELTVLYVAFIGAIIGFLKYNFSKKKIFMGDAGSLFLGFILVVSGIKLIYSVNDDIHPYASSTVLLIIAGIFLVPVLDSLRVYVGRIKRGLSPFTADKTHIHHLFLNFGLSHKLTTVTIIVATLLLMVTILLSVHYFPLTIVLLVPVLLFRLLTNILTMNKNLIDWKSRIHKMEEES